MTGSYEMVGKNGDAETGGIGSDDVIVDVNDGKNSQTNFITANFREEAGKSLNTEQMPLTELLSRSPTPKMKPARTYGCLNADWVDDTCYIRPKYLRFALHKGVLESLRTVLCDKWKMDKPKFLINVFQSNAYQAKGSRNKVVQSSEQRKKLRELVQLGRATDSWFMAHSQTDPMVAYYNKEESQKSATSHRNIVYWKTWSEVPEEVQEKLTPEPGLGRKIHVPDDHVEIVEERNIDQRMLSRQANCFLLPEYTSSNKVAAVHDHLVLVKELAKAFDEDGHRAVFKKFTSSPSIHVCSPINVYVPARDSVTEDLEQLSDDDKDMIAQLLKSGIPTVLLYNSSSPLEEFKEGLGNRLGNDDGICVRSWVTETTEDASSQSFTDLQMGLKEMLLESRKHGVDSVEQKRFKNPIYTDLYLSIVLGLDDECKRILTDDSIRKKEGIKESLVSMIHFYKRYDLLDTCIKSNYDIKMCLYNTSKNDKIEMMLQRVNNSITNKIKVKLDQDKYKQDIKLLTAEFWSFINTMIGKDNHLLLNPMDDPNKLEFEMVIYIFYCFNEEWEMVEIMRKYTDFSIFNCFVAIKAMQKIKEIRSNSSSSDYYDAKELDEQIKKMDRQAGGMVEYSYKRGLDFGPVVFWEHSQYNDKTILDLAAETHSYSILEDKTHIHTYITSRWNGALDPTTWWFKIVLSWLSFGLLAPLLIKFVPRQSKKDETTLFLNERGTERTFLEKVTALWTSPRSKCYLLMITYLVFLLFQTIVILDTTRVTPQTDNNSSISAEEERLKINIIVCLVFVLSFLFVEIDFSQVTRYNIKSKFKQYFKSGYNRIDLLSAFTFLIYAILTFAFKGNEDAFIAAKVILSLSYIGYIVRFTQFLQMFEDIGPKLISIKHMLADLVFFASFLLLTIFAYGIVSEFLLHPYPRTVPTGQIFDILKRPYINMFGELDLDTLEQGIEEGVCKYENYLNGTAVEEANCENYTCDTTCERFKLIARVMLGFYTMVTVILLTNLLVSIFGETYQSDFKRTRQLWQLQKYRLVKEAESQFALPFPPFNFLHSVFRKILLCPCCPTGEKTEFFEQYVKEVEYRCSRQLIVNHEDEED